MTHAAVAPEVILYNGCVATRRPALRGARAVAVAGGAIIAVGRDRIVSDLAGPDTEKINLDGRLLIPGFIDSHIHFYEWAMNRQALKLADLTCLDDLLARVKAAAGSRPQGQWILGQGWNETDWTAPRMPDRKALDRMAPDHPVLLWRCDLHLAVANSAALKLADIDSATPDPPEGRIERNAAGAPTGVLRELAINLVRRAIAPPDTGQVTAAFEEAAKALHRRGVTGIHDIRLMADRDGAGAFRAFQTLDLQGRLDLRCWITLPGDELDRIVDLGIRTGFGNECLRIGHVKFFADGGMGARTAWLIDPYLDAACGMPLTDMETLAQQIDRADQAGLAVMVHAVGDRANRELIGIFEALESRRRHAGRPAPVFPHRIEHAQMIRPEDAARLGNLNLALSVTPCNMVLDMNLIDRAIGKKGHFTYSFRKLLDTGAPVMFSSDCPVCDPAPLLGIHAAVTRQRTDGTPAGGWYPEARVTVAEALKAYTATPAAVHNAAQIGAIVPGNRADLVVLGRNILDLPPEQIPDVRVDMTMFGGRIVHRRF
jgi:predicted amidohydrolase YtcJ